MDVTTIREGIKTNLSVISGLAVHPVMGGSVNPPAALIQPADDFIDYHTANAKGLCTIRFNLQLLVGRQDERRAQEALDAYLSAGTGETKSVVDAIEADKTLNGSCAECIVTGAGPYFSVDQGEMTLGSAILNLTTYAPRT